MKINFNLVLALLFICSPFFTINVCANSEKVEVYNSNKSAQIEFGIETIKKALAKKSKIFQLVELNDWKKNSVEKGIILIDLKNKNSQGILKSLGIKIDKEIQKEGFLIEISKNGNSILIIASDDAGLMYGAFELAEQIDIGGLELVQNTAQNPYMKMRGTKFNIPLDVRTPSYSDVSDAAQKNMAEMWNYDFWTEYIDSLAKYRFNYISLWSMHPFPSLVKVPEYPDVALDDVLQSTVAWKEHYSLNGHLFTESEIFENTKVIKKITIDAKIEFWKRVMRYGKERNVDFYFVTWNIFTYGVDGKYGIDDNIENKTTRDYFRKSVKQMFLTYPDLAGIGLTTGENMYGQSTEAKEDWAFETYGQGVLDAAQELPNRKITFIHRQHMAGAREIAKKFQPLVDNSNINFIFSFKYAKAHVYSSTNQPYHKDFVNDIQQNADLKTIWTLRNDDIFYFRWGAPDFVRDFIKGIPHHVSDGYYYGSDQYVWGREFLSKNVEGKRQLELAKHWYHWMMWGRLGYNPDISNEKFKEILSVKVPETNSDELFEAWQNASMIYPLVTGFHWGSLDFQWYIESGQSRPFYAKTPTGYNDLDFFIELPPHPGTDNIPIPKFVQAEIDGEKLEGTSPIELADSILEYSNSALNWANSLEISKNEFDKIVSDIKSMAYLGKHYAHKIKAATNLERFRKTLDRKYETEMLTQLRTSALYWRYYASNSLAINNNPLWTNRVGHVDWRKSYRNVYLEVRSNGGELDIPSMKSTPAGTILEAEDANFTVAKVENKISNYTGTGYLSSNNGHAYVTVEWEYDAPKEGQYALEFRYSLKRQKHFKAYLSINEKEVDDLLFWESAEPKSWVWDKVYVHLKKGKNTIKINPEGLVNIDHINIIAK